jgi:hypothetical protein
MGRCKKCEEEFNPWPPFVDVFSSVVLVLLLFILVLIVNVAYYTQFNAKINSEASTKSNSDNLQAGADVTDMIALHKIEKPKLDSGGNDSLFSGGKAEGNGISSGEEKKSSQTQEIKELSSGELLVAYKEREIFLDSGVKSRVESFIKKRGANQKIILTVAYPTNLVSSTLKKKIAISRVVDVKNRLKKMGVKLSQIKIEIKAKEDKEYKNGYVKIKLK